MLLRLLALATLLPLILADVQFTSPAGGATVSAGSPIVVQWDEGDGKTQLADLSGYQIMLVVGGSTDATSSPLPATDGYSGDHSTGVKSSKINPSPADGPSGKNAYYLKIISTKKAGGQVINYSQRFTISGMTGKWPSTAIQNAAQSAAGSVSAVPPAQDGASPNAAGGQGDGQDYTAQSGPTRYAPMQGAPPSSITQQNTSPLYPYSGYQVAATYLPTPEAQITVTASKTASYSTHENQASAAPMPGDNGSNNAGGTGGNSDMAKFLRRWKD